MTHHIEKWVRTDGSHYLSIALSDAFSAACDGTTGEIELRRMERLVDARIGPLVAAVNAERPGGFPSGQLFLDSVEQALTAALISGFSVRPPVARIYRGGLTPARVRRVIDTCALPWPQYLIGSSG